MTLVLFFFTACGGRLPSSGQAQSLIRKNFNQYAKKYEASPFGNKKVTGVEVLEINEIHKKLVIVQAFVTMNGSEVFKVRATFEKGPFGWRNKSWENMGGN